MKRTLIGARAVALPGFCTTASAADASIRVQGRSNYTPGVNEMSDYGPSYRLDTGRTLVLRRQVKRYFAQLKGRPEVDVFGRAPGVFESGAGARLVFRDDGDDVSIIGYERLPGASADLGARSASRQRGAHPRVRARTSLIKPAHAGNAAYNVARRRSSLRAGAITLALGTVRWRCSRLTPTWRNGKSPCCPCAAWRVCPCWCRWPGICANATAPAPPPWRTPR